MTTKEKNLLVQKFMCGYEKMPLEPLDYSCNLNLLLSVLEKIESQGYIVEIWIYRTKVCSIYHPNFESNFSPKFETKSDNVVHSIFDVALQYVKWYNLNNK